MNTTPFKRLFVDSWNVYQKIITSNYMFHREIHAEIERLLDSVQASPFAFLDLGCGDASMIGPLLQNHGTDSYTGVDLSDTALTQAACNLASLPCPITLKKTDMLSFLQEETRSYDIIFSSYALHHLNTHDKLAFMKACHRRLKSKGSLILIDITRDEHQNLPDFLDTYCKIIEREWRNLSPEEANHVTNHVRANDLPEQIGDLRAMTLTAGFRSFDVIDRQGCHTLAHISNH